MAARQPNPWWVRVIAGMASYIDAAALVATGELHPVPAEPAMPNGPWPT